MCPLDFRNEKEGSKGWDNKTKLRTVTRHNGGYGAGVPHIAAAVDRRIGIEHFAPSAARKAPARGNHAAPGA